MSLNYKDQELGQSRKARKSKASEPLQTENDENFNHYGRFPDRNIVNLDNSE